jgi:hypothetical protein
MSKLGAVIVANNTENFNYVKLAEHCAARIRAHLNIPVALISDSAVVSDQFDAILRSVAPVRSNNRALKAEKYEWRNLTRTQVYNLTPWDRTLLIDADFFINSDALKNHLLTDIDFAIARECYDPATGYSYVKKLGKSQIDQLWATVMIFNKSTTAEHIFNLADYVLKNYDYYHKLYNFNDVPLRNDYAFTIACHLLGGYGNKLFDIANYKLVNCDFSAKIEEINYSDVLISYKKQIQNQIRIYVQRIKSDIHLMDKISLFEKL